MTEQLRCSEAQSHLHLLVGDDLEAPLTERVHAHLSGCAACAGEFERVRAVRERLVELRHAPVIVNDVWPSVRAELVREGRFSSSTRSASAPRGPQSPSPALRRVAASTWWMAGLAAAAAAALWAYFGVLERSHPEPQRSAPPIAEVTPSLAPSATPVRSEPSDSAPIEPAALALGPSAEMPAPSQPPSQIDMQLASGADIQLSQLRRVEPGDERLRDTALPFVAPGARREPFAGSPRGARSLVSESAWR